MNHVPPETLTQGGPVVVGSAPLEVAPQSRAASTPPLRGQLARARDAERRRIGRELHDDVCQRLAAIEILSTVLMRRIEEPGARRSLWEIIGRVSMLAQDVRLLAHETREPALSAHHLVRRMRAHTADIERAEQLRVGLRVHELPPSLSREIARAVYRIFQEALGNVCRHAHASAAEVTLGFDGVALVLMVEDDGIGFDAAAVNEKDGMGLAGMRERVAEAGGNLQIKSSPDEGTRVRAWIPLPRA